MRKIQAVLALTLIIAVFGLAYPIEKAHSASYSVTVWPTDTLLTNNFVMGYQLDYGISYWRGSTTARQYAETNNYRFVRLHEHRLGKVCYSWNSGSKTGSFNWGAMDDLIQKILDTGGTPIIALGFYYNERMTSIPSGMSSNYQGTYLPDPEQFAAYAVDWVQHFASVGLDVEYYHVFNEPHQYFSWGGTNYARRGYFADFYNTVANAMKAEDPTLNIGNDNCMVSSNNLRNWMASELDVMDFLAWHPYLTGSLSVSDSFLISKSENDEGGNYGPDNFIEPARQVWYDAGFGWLNCISTEENLSYAWQTQEPRMREIINAVCQGLRVNMYVRNNHVLSSCFFHFGHGTSGYFGMVNFNNDFRYYPYWLHYIVFSDEAGRLSVGDSVINSSVSSSNLVSLAWRHGGVNTVMVIHKSNNTNSVSFNGLSGTYDYWLLDITDDEPQTGTVNAATGSLSCTGYAVFVIRQQTGSDDPPAYSGQAYNTTIGGDACNFTLSLTDDVELSGFYFEHNNTGTLANETFVAMSGTSFLANTTLMLNNTAGAVINYKWYANDSLDQWVETFSYSIIVVGENIPQFSNYGTTTNVANASSDFFVYWQDIEGLSGFIFGTNNTGSWINETWGDIGAGSPTSAWSTITKTLNGTVGVTVEWRVWCNDTGDNYGDTGGLIFVTESVSTPDLGIFNTQALANYNNDLEDGSLPFLEDSTGTITILVYSYDEVNREYELRFIVDDTGTSTTEANDNGNGAPYSVTGGSYSYIDPSITVTVSHASAVSVTIAWNTTALIHNVTTGESIGFQSSLTLTVILEVTTGTWNATVNSITLTATTGRVSFDMLNNATYQVDHTAGRLEVRRLSGSDSISARTVLTGGSFSAFNGETVIVEWRSVSQPLVPVTFILGMSGLLLVPGGMIYAINKIQNKKYLKGSVYGLIFVVTGISFIIAWLWQ